MPQVELLSFVCSQDMIEFLRQQKAETDGRAAMVFVQTDNLKGMAHDCGKTKQANDVAVCAKAINHVIQTLQNLNLKSVFAVATAMGNDVKCCIFASKKKRLYIPPQNYPRITDSALSEIENALEGGFNMEYIRVIVETNEMEVFDGIKSKDFKGITKTKAQRKGGQSSVRFERINKENARVNIKSFQDQLITFLADKYTGYQEDCILHFTGVQAGLFADDQEFLTRLNQKVKMFFHVYKDSRSEDANVTRRELEEQTIHSSSIQGKLEIHYDLYTRVHTDNMLVVGVDMINALFKRGSGIVKRIVSAAVCDQYFKSLSPAAAAGLQSIKSKTVLDFPASLAGNDPILLGSVVTDLPEDYDLSLEDKPEGQVAKDQQRVVENEEQHEEGFEPIYYTGPDPDGTIAAIYEYCNIAMDARVKKIREKYHVGLHNTLLGQMARADAERRQKYVLLAQQSTDTYKVLEQLAAELDKCA